MKHSWILLPLLLIGTRPAEGAVVTSVWEGGAGLWSDALAWAPDSVPDNNVVSRYFVVIDGEDFNGSTVTCDLSPVIDSLVVHEGDRLTIQDGKELEITSNGHIRNDGDIDCNLLFLPGPLLLDGTGTVRFDTVPQNSIYTTAFNAGHLVNRGNTIAGSGTIMVSFENEGVILADVPGGALAITPDAGGATNDSVMRAIAGSALDLKGGASSSYTNTNGLIESDGAGSRVILRNISVDGGVIAAVNGGVTEFAGAGASAPIVKDVTLIGDTQPMLGSGQWLAVEGAIDNQGTIHVEEGSISNTRLRVRGAVVLDGGGSIALGPDKNRALVVSDGAGAHLTLEDQTLAGAGALGLNDIGITNRGTIRADLAQPLVIDADSTGFDLEGTLHAAGPGGIEIKAGSFQSSGTIEVDAGSVLTRTGGITQTAGETIVNGTMSASGLYDQTGGLLSGSGTLTAAVQAAGSVAPGMSPGRLTVNGSYTQTAAGVLEVELGGLAPETEHDVLTIAGAASLAGTIAITVLDPFIPSPGDTFEVLVAASVAGSFGSVIPGGFPAGLEPEVLVRPGRVVVSVKAVTGVADGASDAFDGDFAVWPNPVRSGAVLKIQLGRFGGGEGTLQVYDIRGRQVRMLHQAGSRMAGNSGSWDTRDDHGRRVAPGVYFVRFQSGHTAIHNQRVLVIR